MFIEYIKVKNFGIHEDAELQFQDGFVVIRGKNRSGKSTLAIQAVLYSLFGTSTLDATIQDTVTTGKKESELYTELKYGPYLVKRSKASASVVGNGVQISGQAQVSDFFYGLFGLQKGTESLVLVAKQGQTSGILNGKPGEVNSFIEALAGFDQIDTLIDKVKEKFQSGNKQAYEDRIIVLEGRLEELKEVGFPDLREENKKLEIHKEVKHVADTNLITFDLHLDITRQKLSQALTHNNRLTLIENDIKNKKEVVGTGEAKLVLIDTSLEKIPVYEKKTLHQAANLLLNVDELNKLWQAYIWSESLVDLEDVWEGSLEEFQGEHKSIAEDVNRLTKAIATDKADLRSKKKQVVTDKTCKSCGQGVEHLHTEINRKLSKEIESLEVELKLYESGLEERKETLDLLNQINNEQIRRTKAADLNYLTPNLDVVPHTYYVIGEQPAKPDSKAVQAASDLLAEHKSSLVRLEDLRVDRETVEKVLARLREEDLPELEKKLADLGEIKDTEVLTTSIDGQVKLRNETSEGLIKTISTINDCTLYIKKVELEMEAHDKTVSHINEDIKVTKELLDKDARNAKVVKSVREAKPKVLEMVWSKILYSVAQKYSEMLGEEMLVEKDAKGFRINGRPVARLSGAEKISLGIALRATLRDVFAPTCPFMFFDEPMESSDEDNTATILAVMQNLGGQVLIVTHEDISSTVEGQIIEIGN